MEDRGVPDQFGNTLQWLQYIQSGASSKHLRRHLGSGESWARATADYCEQGDHGDVSQLINSSTKAQLCGLVSPQEHFKSTLKMAFLLTILLAAATKSTEA